MYERIKRWYQEGRWTKQQVKMAVLKGAITRDQYDDIVGEAYTEE